MAYSSRRKAISDRKGPYFSTSRVYKAKVTDPYRLPVVPYYDASQQQPTAEQGKYSPMPGLSAAYHPGLSTAESNCSGETLYAPVSPSYTEQASDPAANDITQPSPAEKPEDDQPSKERPKNPVTDAITGIISLAIMGAILYGLGVGVCKAHDHTHKATPPVKAPSQTTATQQFQPPSGVQLVTLYGPSTTLVSWVDFGPDGTGLEGSQEK